MAKGKVTADDIIETMKRTIEGVEADTIATAKAQSINFSVSNLIRLTRAQIEFAKVNGIKATCPILE